MFDTYGCVLGAVIVLIPLTSITHFIPPPSNCLLADICNHTWIPECGEHNDDYRIFIDDCDMWEYNCDYKRNFQITNYSLCFLVQRPQTCPPAPPCPACPTCPTQSQGLRMGQIPFGKVRLNYLKYGILGHTHHPPGQHGRSWSHPYLGIFFHSYNTTTPIFTGLRPERTPGWRNPHRRRYTPEEGRKLTVPSKATTKARTSVNRRRFEKGRKITKEIIRTGTTPMLRRDQQTAVLKVLTVIKNGKMVVKVIKGRVKHVTVQNDNSDSDYLE